MLRRPVRRAGFSLVEVLVAIFITAAGLIALLTLFPLGAFQMGKALQDDRSQQMALQMDGKMREMWRAQWVEGGVYDPYIAALDDADAGPVFNPLFTPPAPPNRTASYPVMVDPLGQASYPSKLLRVGQSYGGFFPRRTISPAPATSALAFRFATLQDDMEYGPDGTPADRDGFSVNASGQPIFRGGRYNCAAVIQRQDNSNRFVADLKLLVFDRRVPGVDPTGANENELMFPRAGIDPPLTVAVGSKQVVFPVGNDTLGLRRGAWIMDGTIDNAAGSPNNLGIRNANFYKVVSYAEDVPVAGQTTVELHIPIVRPTGDTTLAVGATYNANLYILRELIDVYDRPQLTPSGYLKQSP